MSRMICSSHSFAGGGSRCACFLSCFSAQRLVDGHANSSASVAEVRVPPSRCASLFASYAALSSLFLVAALCCAQLRSLLSPSTAVLTAQSIAATQTKTRIGNRKKHQAADHNGAAAGAKPKKPKHAHDASSAASGENKKHASANVSPVSRLYADLLGVVFGFLWLRDLHRVLTVSRSWSAVVRSMPCAGAELLVRSHWWR